MTAPTLSLEVRRNLIDALQIDLIVPTGPLGHHNGAIPPAMTNSIRKQNHGWGGVFFATD